MEVTYETIRNIVVMQLGCEPEEVQPWTTWDELGADSLDKVELTMAFETEFSLDIPDELAAEWKCLLDALNHFGAIMGHPYLFTTPAVIKDATSLTREQILAMT